MHNLVNGPVPGPATNDWRSPKIDFTESSYVRIRNGTDLHYDQA